ncbi:MAG: cation transporter, partial [Clostridiales bacterium]|nr:cation transporter [Clostridiales bacterium]
MEKTADIKILWTVLLINFSVFAVEIAAGLIANSMGLMADSLDELADALVYALSIYAVTGAASGTKRLRRLFSAIRHRKLHLVRSVGFKTERRNQAVSYDIKK